MDELRRYARKDDPVALRPFEALVASRRPWRRIDPPLVVASLLVVLVVVIAVMSADSLRYLSPAASSVPTPVPGEVTVNAAAFKDKGVLAFSVGDRLHVLDGRSGRLTKLSGAAPAQWSPSGAWLAYERRGSSDASLWLSSADGTGQHRVADLPSAPTLSVAWSPIDDVLAVAPQGGLADGLWLVRPGQPARRLVGDRGTVWSIAWSAQGQQLAYSITLPTANPPHRTDGLFTVSPASGESVQRFVTPNDGILGIEWWPDGAGIVYYRDIEHSASLMADGVPLESRSLDGSRHSGAFSATRVDVFNEWIDTHRFVGILGSGRWPWTDRRLAVCDVETLTCVPLPHADGMVDLEPSLSFDRKRIALVRAADRGPVAGFSDAAAAGAWMATRRLVVLDLRTNTAVEMQSAGTGVSRPVWDRSGQQLLLTRDRAGWIFDVRSGNSVQLIAPLETATPVAGIGWSFDWLR